MFSVFSLPLWQALNGFLMMMTQNGKLLYISDNAAEYLGHSMVSGYFLFTFFCFVISVFVVTAQSFFFFFFSIDLCIA